MDMTNRDDMGRNALDEDLTARGTRDEMVSPEEAGTHDADGTMGRTAGTGAGAISGGVIGASLGGPVGAAIGAVAGAVIGHGGGNAAHKVGDDHDDMNVETQSSGDLGRHTGAGAGSISGAAVGAVAGGPIGAVAGAVGGGMLGAAAGDASKHMGGDNDDYVADRPVGMRSDMNMNDDVNMRDDMNMRDTSYGTTEHINDNVMRVPVVEEELNVQKQAQQAGEVRVAKHVEEEQVNVPVSLTREEVHVERHPVNRAVQPGETVLGENDTIRVPVMEETVAVTKDARVVEEIEISKERITEQQTVSDTVRREHVDVEDTTHTMNPNQRNI